MFLFFRSLCSSSPRRVPGAMAAVVVVLGAITAARPAAAQIIVNALDGTTVTPETLANTLLGGGLTINSATYSGAFNASGRFQNANGIFDVTDGVVLTTGNADNIVGPNDNDSAGVDNFRPGDAALAALAGTTTGNTFDASILTINFTPLGNTVQFTYVFGSEEYNEFVDQGFNDVFGFFVNGTNYALVPGTASLPVSIDTINATTNSTLYVNNDPSDFVFVPFPGTQLDGFTRALTLQAPVTPGAINTLRLAITDVGDGIYDSAVMIQAGSLVSFGFVAPEPGTMPLTGAGIAGGLLLLAAARRCRQRT